MKNWILLLRRLKKERVVSPKVIKISEKKDLEELYEGFIPLYRDIFNHKPIKLFKHVEFTEINSDQIDFRNIFSSGDALQIENRFQAISDKIIEFTTILSFLNSDILQNEAIYNLLFVFFFQDCDHSEIVKQRGEIISEIRTMFEQFVQTRVTFLDMVLQILPLKMLLSDFLLNISPNISNEVLLQNLRVYYQRYLLSTLNFKGVRSTLNQQLILPDWFQSQKKNNQISQYMDTLSKKPYMFITMALHYEKVGLNLYFTHIHFTNASNTSKVIRKFFMPIPYLTVFTISQNRFFTFYATMPENGLVYLERFLHKLKSARYIHEYKITQAISSDHCIQFNKKNSGNILLSQMKLFSSKEYSKSSINKLRSTPFEDNLILIKIQWSILKKEQN